MERKDVLNLEKLCLENDNLLAFPLAADLLGVPYANLYKFFRSGRNEGLFLREKVGAMYYIKFAPSLPQNEPPLDQLNETEKLELKELLKNLETSRNDKSVIPKIINFMKKGYNIAVGLSPFVSQFIPDLHLYF